MYNQMKADSNGHFNLSFSGDSPFRILQLTDMHLGFGPLSKKTDREVMDATKALIERSSPDLVVLTGDMIYPFLPKSGTLDNGKQMKRLISFMDSFKIPYTMVFGNHDVEMGSRNSKEDLADIIKDGTYSIFSEGDKALTGVGNFIINILGERDRHISSLLMLDSNMYGNGWFFSGFDCIHNNQVDWAMKEIEMLKMYNPELKAHAFYHMPLADFKHAYEKMKLGDRAVKYKFGSVGELNDYFGISNNKCSFFERAVEEGSIKTMFCGHDHLNTISLVYQDIQLTYGMSLDFHAYSGIKKRYTQRGGTILTIQENGDFDVIPLPLDRVVSKFVRGRSPY